MRLILLAGLILPLTACHVGGDESPGIAGSGSGNQRSYAVSDFSRVELAGPDDADVRVGSSYSVRAQGSPAALAALRIDKKDDTLEIGRRRDAPQLAEGDKVKLFVTLPRLAGAGIAGSGIVSVDRVEGAGFKAEIAGSGTLAVAKAAVDQLDAEVAGSGRFTVTGTAKTLNVDIAGSGNIDAPGLTATSGAVSIAGSGGVRAVVNGPAKVEIMGSGDVDLGPGAKCTVSKMGSGNVRCGG